jgi:hypothetical protein
MARILRGMAQKYSYTESEKLNTCCSREKLIPEPRCLNNIRSSVEKNRYKDVLDAYTDLTLVFWNALFYNEPGSQIAEDAETLKVRVCSITP